MKYRPVEWSREARDFVPVAPRQRRFLNVFENAVGLVLFVVGLILFIALLHYLPDTAQVATQLTRGNP